jgi:hypothetical protein
MWFDNGKLWLGRHKELDVLLVVEKRDAENKDDHYIEVFYLDDLEFVQSKRDFLKQRVENVATKAISEDLDTLTKEYWEKKSQAIRNNHSAHLKRYGIASKGTKPRSKQRPVRITHCWSCKKNLDSTIDLECCSCGWILCRCGACGCAYNS